jgi:hypothetical protein
MRTEATAVATAEEVVLAASLSDCVQPETQGFRTLKPKKPSKLKLNY